MLGPFDERGEETSPLGLVVAQREDLLALVDEEDRSTALVRQPSRGTASGARPA